MSEEEMEASDISFKDEIVKAQKAVEAEEWERVVEIFSSNNTTLLFAPFDLVKNTAIHVIARSGNKQCLKELLQMLPKEMQIKALKMPNYEENTPLHEAVFSHDDPKMVDLIIGFMPSRRDIEELLEMTNKENETAAFRAARYGRLGVIKYLHAKLQPQGLQSSRHFPPNININRRVQRPILHTCVLNFTFGAAIWLLENVDKNLAKDRICLLKHEEKSEATTACLQNEKEVHTKYTCLKLLSKMPLAFESTDTLDMGLTKRILYGLLPEDGYESELEDDAKNNSVKVTRDEESSQPDDGNKKTSKPKVGVFSRINYAFWKHAKGWPWLSLIGKIWDQKKRHKLAERLVKLLFDSDEEAWKTYDLPPLNEPIVPSLEFPSNVTEKKEDMKLKDRVEKEERVKKSPEDKQSIMKLKNRVEKEEGVKNSFEDKQSIMKPFAAEESETLWKSTLFVAAASGILEVVNLIYEKCPEAISFVNEDGLNILHVAVKHRQFEIYEFIEKTSAYKILIQRISKDKRTILHQAGSMEFYREQGLAGVAYQLQRELEWYHRVREKIPTHYLMHADKDGLTAGDLLDIHHAEMHDQAKQWMKETAQSCSTVAVLIAGVVFAAAYAIPGGSEGGRPVLRKSPAFRIFTIMDVVALATSLGSVVMFLSILTSSFNLWEFHKTLPRKLKLGFVMLFFALITTMLAFAATILLTIHMEGNKSSTTVAYSVAFVIVSIFGMTQFPLYKMAEDQVRAMKKWCGPKSTKSRSNKS